MANMCNHTVQFQCGMATMENIKLLFEAMAARQQIDHEGQLPHFIEQRTGFMFDILWEDTDSLSYQTRWSPNLQVLQSIAEHFGTDFTSNYEETGNCIYGEATYKDGQLCDVALEWEDFDLYDNGEETDRYHFEGGLYESDNEILEIILERRKANRLTHYEPCR